MCQLPATRRNLPGRLLLLVDLVHHHGLFIVHRHCVEDVSGVRKGGVRKGGVARRHADIVVCFYLRHTVVGDVHGLDRRAEVIVLAHGVFLKCARLVL